MKRYDVLSTKHFWGSLIIFGVFFFIIGKLFLDNFSETFGGVYHAAEYITVEEARITTGIPMKRRILRTGIQSVFFSVVELSDKVAKNHIVERLKESFGRFLHNFDRMLDELTESERLKQELETAHNVQMGLMPALFPKINGFDIYGLCSPARMVGGDFYDYFWLGEGKEKLGIVLVDVSDKGMSAAMIATFTSGLILSESHNALSPSDMLNQLNYPLYLKTEKKMFVACQVAILDVNTGKLQFANSGQPYPIVQKNNKLSELETKGVRYPLGIVTKEKYQSLNVNLKEANFIIFHTDGLTEAMNEKRELYDDERLKNVVQGLQSKISKVTAKDIVETILADVKQFTGEAEQNDDLTIVVIKIN